MQDNVVSIITPLYNGEKYVAKTIESVLSQTYKDWEMIIVNDGSKDNSEQIAKEYAAKDSRIKVFLQPNGGSASARNNGIQRAEGRYICLLDADDLWDSNFLESQLNLMREKNAQLVYSSYRRIDENGKEILKPEIAKPQLSVKDMERMDYIGCLTGMYDTKTMGKKYLDISLKSLKDDYAYWLDIIKSCGTAYGNRQVIASYRILVNSMTGNKRKLIIPQFLFYYKYQKLGLLRSIYNTIYWGIAGIRKFYLNF